MLEYWRDGQRVECHAIYGNGKVGQIVVLANVSFGQNPDFAEKPLAAYTQPAFFTIKERRVVGEHGYEYDLVDKTGKVITVNGEHTDNWWLYDADEWGQWQIGHFNEKVERKDGEIKRLTLQRDLLKSILVAQGIRIVTKEQAEALGLSTK
jgi:hypothetical protein